MAKNWELLLSTFETIVRNPQSWQQSDWASPCGTAYCFAGHASILAGGKQVQSKDVDGGYGYGGEDWVDLVKLPAKHEIPNLPEYDKRAKDGSPLHQMARVGREALGLEYHEASQLFDSGNTALMIWGMLTGWITTEMDSVVNIYPYYERLDRLNDLRYQARSVDEMAMSQLLKRQAAKEIHRAIQDTVDNFEFR